MTNSALKKKKIGEVLCDIGKYMLTVIPFTYFMADKPETVFVLIATAIIGSFLIVFGIYFVSHSTSIAESGNSRKRKVKILKNSVFVIEEEKQESSN